MQMQCLSLPMVGRRQEGLLNNYLFIFTFIHLLNQFIMARSAKTGDGTLYFDLQTKEGEKKACFLVRKAKGDDGKYVEVERVTDLSNVYLEGSIKFETKDYKGKDSYRSMSIKLRDGDDNTGYVINSRFNNASVALLNNLLNVENQSIQSLDFQFRVNKNGYPTIYVSYHDSDELLGFAVDWKEIPKMESTEFAGKTLWDSSKRDAFMEAKINEKFGVYGSRTNAQDSSTPSPATEPTQNEDAGSPKAQEADDGDIPF